MEKLRQQAQGHSACNGQSGLTQGPRRRVYTPSPLIGRTGNVTHPEGPPLI